LKTWTCTRKLVQIPDVFNDNIDFTCHGFDDLVRLNQGMLPVALKYRFFGETNETMKILEKFRVNFEVILSCLEDIQCNLNIDLKIEMRNDMQLKVDYLNKIMTGFKEEINFDCPMVCWGCGKGVLETKYSGEKNCRNCGRTLAEKRMI